MVLQLSLKDSLTVLAIAPFVVREDLSHLIHRSADIIKVFLSNGNL